MFINYLKFFCLLFFLNFSFYVRIDQTYSMEQQAQTHEEGILKFKVGFEFQESNKLCEQTKDMINVQKQPIFTIHDKEGKELCHLVIDGYDIEFVTPPFSSDKKEQREALENSIKNIILSCQLLKELANRTGGHGVSFEQWVTRFSEALTFSPRDKKF